MDPLRGPRWYAALAVAAALLWGAWVMLGGAPGHVIQIDWAWAGDLAAGAEVVVDGAVVGRLEKVGGRPVTGFEVEPGTHEVTLRGGPCRARPDTVTLGPVRTVVLMADVDDRVTGCFLFFR